MAKFIVRYIGNGFLHLKSLGLTFKKGDSFELVSKTGLRIDQLENHFELVPHIGESLLIDCLEKDSGSEKIIIKENDNSEINAKLDLLLKSLTVKNLESLVDKALSKRKITREQNKSHEDSEDEEKLRKELIKDLAFREDNSVINLQNFGKSEKKVETDEIKNVEDLIDF